MKLRAGFVSNSSSSSFLLVGIRADETKLSLDEIEALGLETANNGELVGVHHYIGEYETEAFSFADLAKDAQKVRDALGVEPRVYSGMECS